METITRAAAETAMNEYCAARTIYLSNTTEMEMQLNEIRNRFASAINDAKERMEAMSSRLEQFAIDHRIEMNERRTLRLFAGKIGYRIGKPRLTNRDGYPWDAILKLVKLRMSKYIRIKEELDKSKLLSDRNDPKTVQNIRDCGMDIVQEETFFVQPKED